MSVGDPWQPFREVLRTPWEHVRAWKAKTGRNVIGHLVPDVPEEIIHAVGALPVAVEGAGVQISRSQEHLPSYTCSHAMGAVELALLGNLDVLDGMVIPYACDTTRNLFHVWSHCFPHMANEFLRLPKRIDYPGARSYLRSEFQRLMEALGRVTGRRAGPEELGAGIALYNRSRALLRKAYRRQIEMPAVWTMERVQTLFASAVKCARDDHVAWMERLPWDEQAPDSLDRVAVYVRGKVWDPPGLLDMFDRLGLLVVADEIVTGFRGVEVDATAGGDPLEALVERHFAMIPYTGYHVDPSALVTGFLSRVLASGAKGVLFLNPKFCEAAAFDTPDLQKALEEAGVPNLVLETSSRGVSMGQISLRIEAFREMIGGDL